MILLMLHFQLAFLLPKETSKILAPAFHMDISVVISRYWIPIVWIPPLDTTVMIPIGAKNELI